MNRVKIELPNTAPLASLSLAIRIGDINYGNHLANDALLSLLHEARLQMLGQWGFSELDAGGAGLIMADAVISYKREAFYGELLTIKVFVDSIDARSFDLYYAVSTQRRDETVMIATAKTGMVCFDYQLKKPVAMPDSFRQLLTR